MSGPPPHGMREEELVPNGPIVLVPDDGRPPPCGLFGGSLSKGHDSMACPDCLRRRAWAKAAVAREVDDGEGWAAYSLVHAEPVPEPTILWVGGRFLLRRGWITLIHGAFGSGKTPLTYLAVVEQVQAGNAALIIDHEMGPAQAKALLLELGLTLDQIEAGVIYVNQPPPLSEAGRRRLIDQADALGRDLAVVVIDSLTESLTTIPGMSDNDSIDVAAWAQELPAWLRDQFYAAVLVIDHSGVNDGPRPSGSHKKREFPQFHLWCRKVTPFSKASPETGMSELWVMKDRSGDMPINQAVATLRTNETTFYLAPEDPLKAGEIEVPLDMQPMHSTAEEVYADLVKAGEEGVMRSTLTGGGAAGTYRRRVLETLLAEGGAVEKPEPGSSRGRRCWADVHAP